MPKFAKKHASPKKGKKGNKKNPKKKGKKCPKHGGGKGKKNGDKSGKKNKNKKPSGVVKSQKKSAAAVVVRNFGKFSAKKSQPQPVLGKIYFGSGRGWGGGGGVMSQVGDINNPTMQWTCNPLFRMSPSGYPRRSSQRLMAQYLSKNERNVGEMKGGGVGAVFSSIFRTLVPVFKGIFRVGSAVAKSPVGQAIKNEAIKSGLNAGINVVGDALRGRNVLQAAKNRVTQQAIKLPTNIERAVTKTGSKKPTAVSTTRGRPKKKLGSTVPATKTSSPPKAIDRKTQAPGVKTTIKRGLKSVVHSVAKVAKRDKSHTNRQDIFTYT